MVSCVKDISRSLVVKSNQSNAGICFGRINRLFCLGMKQSSKFVVNLGYASRRKPGTTWSTYLSSGLDLSLGSVFACRAFIVDTVVGHHGFELKAGSRGGGPMGRADDDCQWMTKWTKRQCTSRLEKGSQDPFCNRRMRSEGVNILQVIPTYGFEDNLSVFDKVVEVHNQIWGYSLLSLVWYQRNVHELMGMVMYLKCSSPNVENWIVCTAELSWRWNQECHCQMYGEGVTSDYWHSSDTGQDARHSRTSHIHIQLMSHV